MSLQAIGYTNGPVMENYSPLASFGSNAYKLGSVKTGLVIDPTTGLVIDTDPLPDHGSAGPQDYHPGEHIPSINDWY